jgi:hypothetical protein
MRGRLAALLIVVPLATACAGPVVPTAGLPASAASSSSTTSSSTSASTFSPGPATAAPIASPSSRPTSSPAAAVLLDQSLLGILPPDVDGIPVAAEPDSFAQAAADPDFVRNVASAVFAVVVDGADLASGVVARLRPGRYSETLFRDWRDSYNEGACAQAGGVARNAQADMDGRTVYIASCAGGLRVYHAYLPERGTIVSLFSTGDRRFGERLMSDLRP